MSNLTPETLTTLVASRILHDLVSPLGAIGNGMELLEMTGGGAEEMALIKDSVQGATARIELFRMAFGAVQAGQCVSEAQVRRALGGIGRSTKVACDWQIVGEITRTEARLACLAAMCAESALPYGGTIEITDGWTVHAQGQDIRVDGNELDLLEGRGCDAPPASKVQFALLPMLVHAAGRLLTVERSGRALTLRF